MIHIRKGPAPVPLASKAGEWTNQYLRHLAEGTAAPESLREKYKLPAVKLAILSETHEKCAYCESKVTHVYPGDVEHILPKSRKPELIFEWSNLTLACLQCNVRKLDYFDEREPLVNPIIEEPSEHLAYYGPFCCHHPGDAKGELTQRLLDLNRPELLERRKERLEAIIPLIDHYSRVPAGPLKDLLKKEILSESADDKEYALMVRKFLSERLPTP